MSAPVRVFRSGWSGLVAPWCVSVRMLDGGWMLIGCADTWEIAIRAALNLPAVALRIRREAQRHEEI